VESPVEIERKFLARVVPLRDSDGVAMRQGYLAISADAEVRIRDAEGAATLTVKSGGGLVRRETEIEITSEQFEALWPATAGRRIEKRRSVVPVGDLTAELDLYDGDLEGLAIVEIEFDTVEAAAALAVPDWFGREVTEDSAYKNASLAVCGRPVV
jgi:CYTH domain-containing protein